MGSSRLSPESIDANELTHETGADEQVDSQASRSRLASKQDQLERMAREKYLSDVKMPTGGRINENKFRNAVRHLRSQRKGRRVQSKYEEEFSRSGVYRRLWEESQKKRELSRAQEMYVNGERNREWVRSREGEQWEDSVVIDHITGQRHVNVLAIVKQL